MTQRCIDCDLEVCDTAQGRGMSRRSSGVEVVVLPDSKCTICVLCTDSWYVSECFVVSGLPTVWIWDCANAGCHSWNPLTFLSALCVPLTED